MRLLKLLLPQHRLKRKINRYILKKKNKGIRVLFYTFLRDKYANKYGIEIGVNSIIDGPINFPHPRNIIIGENVCLGKNATIFNDVILGQKNGFYPSIGDNVIIYPGSVVVGRIHIGDNVIIGANSFVNHDIESNTVVAGNPASTIEKRNNK